jgi:diguanylate cyclase (GGDEF)-like protein
MTAPPPATGIPAHNGAGVHSEDRLTETERLRSEVARLSGLANRRAWHDQLVRELARARRFQEPLSLALLDLDRFKSYNDTHGHRAGDGVLVEAARAWRRELRDIDLLCRWGGDEFVLLLPNCSRGDADAVVARVARATPRGQTCAVGVVCWNRRDTPEALVERADAAMYEAKHG